MGRKKQDALDGARKRYAEETARRVRSAINLLVSQGRVPSFYSIANSAQVARSTLYRRTDLRQMVEQARKAAEDAQAIEPHTPSYKELEEINRQLCSDINRLRRMLRSVCQERDDLHSAVAELSRSPEKVIEGDSCRVRYAFVSLDAPRTA